MRNHPDGAHHRVCNAKMDIVLRKHDAGALHPKIVGASMRFSTLPILELWMEMGFWMWSFER